jgi:hypothetical protein
VAARKPYGTQLPEEAMAKTLNAKQRRNAAGVPCRTRPSFDQGGGFITGSRPSLTPAVNKFPPDFVKADE